jgi:gliding motility-associatede transport system auxiliary component
MQRYASLLGGLGAVAVLFALISFLIQLLSGGGVLLQRDLAFSVANLVVGLALLAVSLGSNLEQIRERMKSGEARRASRYGTSAILGTALGIALLALLAFLSTRYHKTWDWTEAKSHSLTEQTHKLLEGLDQPVKITALYAQIAASEAKDLLERYQTAAPGKVEVEYVDPQAQPGRLAELGIEAGRLEGGLLHVALGKDSVDVKELTEVALTQAIVKLSRHEQKKVYFLDGHNERSIEGEGATEGGGMKDAADALRNENYQVETLLLAAKGDVPKDADVVIDAGPTRPLHETEHAALERYLERGGALLVLIDPRAGTDLGDDLRRWGVDVGDDVIVDRVQGLFGRPTTVFAAEYGDHDITRKLGDATLFHVARSVLPVQGAAAAIAPIVRTGESSWAERDMERLLTKGEAEYNEGVDVKGPVSLAVAGTIEPGKPAPAAEGETPKPPPTARLVVIGDSDFVSNQLIHEFRNRDLFVNAVNWLLGDVEAISVRPGQPRASRLQLSGEQFLEIRYLALFVMPELIALCGVIAWWQRRRAPGR